MQLKKHIHNIRHRLFSPDPARNGLPVIPLPDGPPAQTKAGVDAYLQLLFADIAAYAPAPVPSSIVTGAMRCGKTLVAQQVALRNRLYHIPGDRLRNATHLGCDQATKLRLVKYIYKRLLLAHPTGLLLEGTIFLDNGVTLPHWATRRGVPCFAIGYALDDPARKAESMIAFRKVHDCWTSHSRSDADLHRMARQIVQHSKDIKARCAANGWSYFDLDSAAFDSERQRIVRTVEKQLRGATIRR
ncbi:hypothetical protein [Roseinatronobacter alkalisoli]|uniref:AAA family ATPase n=1 Tax=Roseinatronobacter alkalisoli TaxID=3028235 RepID=A0ABT5TDJ8_9RHOB|nr:hypothetical protein [Roseinatronobacter sp. HJB301]MDD7973179.1 hypothetical protein [Roseinatronobacter sp. HJB301]